MPERITRTCNVCEAMCGMVVTVDGNRVTEIRPDKEDVFSRGHICPKGPAMREVLDDPDRLRHPVKRTPTGTGWERISWKQAFDECAAGLLATRQAHGDDALGLYVGNPSVHNHGTALFMYGFARALRTRNRFDANSQDANPKLFACMLMYGDQVSITLPDVDRTDYMLMLGANPAASNGSLMTLGDVKGRLTGIRARGGKLVLVDPRRTETAAWADEHLAIRPGGDAAFLLGVMHVVLQTVDETALAATTRGLADLKTLAAGYPPERVAAACGIDAATIRRVAKDLVAAKRAVVYGRVGTCQNPFGAVASWLIEALNVVTGNFDREGGAMFASPAVDLAAVARKVVGNHYDRWRSRVRGLPELSGQLPASVMAEEMETPGPGQIRAFVTIAGNPVLSTANGERLAAALAKLDFMVAIDFYINETTRHASIILPPTHSLEHGHYDLIFHGLAVRNTTKYSPRVVAPAEDTREDWEILYELAMRLGGLKNGNAVGDWLLKLGWRAGMRLHPDRVLDLLLRFSPHKGLSLAKVKQAIHGIDLGPLVPSWQRKVVHPDGKVDLAPAVLLADAARVAAWLDAFDKDGPADLVLIGRRHLRTNNSWMHNAHSLVKGPDRSQLMMHSSDAERLGLVDGATVKIASRTGSVDAVLGVTDALRPGVVSLPHGYGHAACAATQRIAGPLPGPNMNAITDDSLVEPLTGTAVLNGVPVTVRATPPPG